MLRELGEPCSGGEPFLYAHATAAFRIEDAGGKTVLRGELPEGKAIAALNHDPGVPRVPTFCRFELHADLASGREVPARARARAIRCRSPSRTGRATAVLG